jgi:hypothetical protein
LAEIWYLVTSFTRYHILWETFLDPSDSYFLFAEERGYHKWALAHSSSCFTCFRPNLLWFVPASFYLRDICFSTWNVKIFEFQLTKYPGRLSWPIIFLKYLTVTTIQF